MFLETTALNPGSALAGFEPIVNNGWRGDYCGIGWPYRPGVGSDPTGAPVERSTRGQNGFARLSRRTCNLLCFLSGTRVGWQAAGSSCCSGTIYWRKRTGRSVEALNSLCSPMSQGRPLGSWAAFGRQRSQRARWHLSQAM